MYTPLKAMEMIGNIITVEEDCNRGEINERSNTYLESLPAEKKDRLFTDATIICNKMHDECIKDMRARAKDNVRNVMKDFEDYVGLECRGIRTFSYQVLIQHLYSTWTKAKRVYKFSSTIGKSLMSMKSPAQINYEILKHLPSNCFYMDYAGAQMFDDSLHGTFVQCKCTDELCMLNFVHCRYDTTGNLNLHTGGFAILIYDVDDVKTFDVDLSDIPDDNPIRMNDGSVALCKTKTFYNFFINFCIYLSAINKDIEYTPQTKANYRPRPANQKPSNKMREVEEFGVGMHYSTLGSHRTRTVHTTKVDNPDRIKRSYTANWRSAHWHSYWVNDTDNPGSKKKIWKWVAETFVSGNNAKQVIQIQRVTKAIQ